MEQIDLELIKGLINGEHRANSMLIRLYFHPLTLYAKSILNDSEQAKDIVQEIFMKLWNNREDLATISTLKPYLYKSVHNACIDLLRKKRSRKSINAISYDDSEFRLQMFEVQDEFHFVNNLFSEEFEQILERAVEKLPQQCKEIFILSRFEQLTYPQIAEKLSVSLSTVKTQMVRAMQKIAEELKPFLK
jgi:RNA polymerase sigma-70 factor (ECF subfamily)